MPRQASECNHAKRRLMKFNGVKVLFELQLKECEWRYNKALPQLRFELLSLCKNPLRPATPRFFTVPCDDCHGVRHALSP
jgi:hypothetical protein